MRFPMGPFAFWAVSVQTAQMMAEAQIVMAMRFLGMAGAWTVTPAETLRMVLEKPGAFVRSASSASAAVIAGKRPDQIAEAAIRPLRRKTRANARRLGRAGPKKR